jgi:thiosulfate reductase cytochrome b subunit
MPRPMTIHPLIVRVTHWVNAVAVIIMIGSGLAIHNAFPILPAPVPGWLTFGGFIDALRWHFAAMWLLALNGLVMLAFGLFTGRYRRKLLPIRAIDIWGDSLAALSGKLSHADLSVYNAVQRLLYLSVLLALALAVVSGLALWKPVQFGWLTALLGDFDSARLVHFGAMAFITGFIMLHVIMALLVPRSLLAMIRGH